MEIPESDPNELVEFWTLLDEDRALLAGRRGATALGFALLLKFYSRHGRVPRSWAEIPETVVGLWLARSASKSWTWLPTSGPDARLSITAPRSGTISCSGWPRLLISSA